ncbi:hypothetical protein J4Q44_G00283160 [Coregonus suidteri]|uniref:RRM domain-containing protein n=1 Tax=Coregonus suidteri TaxID=861788 RepID=A0AAN8KY56_9TELE
MHATFRTAFCDLFLRWRIHLTPFFCCCYSSTMSLIEEYEEGEYERAPKRLKTMDVEGEDLEEGEDSDTASAGLLGDEEDATRTGGENRARWSTKKYGSGRKDNGEDAHRIAPSPVVHVRGLCESVVEGDLVEALEKFGNICYVMMMPFKRQALVEFEAMESADHKRITRPTNADDPNSGNKVLLLSIQNPLYPITTDVLYTVCNPIGNVLRIVIFKRNGIQAMVEYPFWSQAGLLQACKAKSALNGADIYAGSCTLKIEYARPTRLNVLRNDNDSWDYTKPFLVRRERGKGRQRQAILGEHPSSYSDNGYGSHCPLLPLPSNNRYKRRFPHDAQEVVAYPLPQTSSYMGHASSSSVAMVSGLHPAKMNCTRIFNLFCLYGNIEKVKFMKSVPGTALVEMGDEYAVDRSITHLNSIKVFSKRLNVCVQAARGSTMFELEDGQQPTRTSLTRTSSAAGPGVQEHHPAEPPGCAAGSPALTEEGGRGRREGGREHDVPSFIKFKVFDAKPSSKTISGLFEFDNKTHAVEVLTVLNHHQIRIPNGSNPYTLKLCFSTSSHL